MRLSKPLSIQHLAPYLFLLPALAIMLIFMYLPILENFFYSLFRWSSIDPRLFYVGLSNYKRILSDPIIALSLRNNVLYAVISVFFQVFIALVLAAILESGAIRPRWGTTFRNILFLPSVLAVTVVGLTWQLIYRPDTGLLNQLLEVIGLTSLKTAWLGNEKTAIFAIIAVSQWQWVGYVMILFIVAIQAIPEEFYEAARIDGANRIQQFFRITVPLVRETTLVWTTITVIGAFKVFDIVWVMTAGGPNHASEVLGNYLYRVGFRNDEMGYAAAIASLLFIITFLLTFLQLRIGRSGEEI
ncbi:MAG: carbohydrate ABC transporter permease [Thermanaerothrix sp.]|uniref:carbohydrate ABC transporter permease n=1 Tax=Thermanaerothrix sp. TaxID=2972675 RepID=UPI003C7AC168